MQDVGNIILQNYTEHTSLSDDKYSVLVRQSPRSAQAPGAFRSGVRGCPPSRFYALAVTNVAAVPL